jgi:hypothetical protein
MDKKYDIYITYPYSLVKSEDKLRELIETFTENLQNLLDRILGYEISFIKKGSDFSDHTYGEFLSLSSVFVFFTHSIFDVDADYKNELKEICDQVGLENKDLTNESINVFKVCLETPKGPLNPPCLDQLLSYNFYSKNIYNRKIRSLDFNSDDKTGVAYSKLLDLAFDISESIKCAANKKSEDDEVRYVYLGLTSFDQEDSRDEIRRELHHNGFKVLPNLDMPDTSEEFKNVMLANLKRTDFAVQIMGSQYGDLLKGSKYSMPDFQNQIIKEYQKNGENRLFKRLIWIPQNVKISDQRQALYLKRLRRDEAEMNTEIIESPLENFKTVLADKIGQTNHTEQPKYENISKVYLLTEEDPEEEYEQLYSTLALSGLRVYTLDYTEQIGIYTRHLQFLRISDAIIVFQQNSNEYWLRSKLRDIIKAPGIGKREPYKKVVIISKIKPDPELLKMINSKIEIINKEELDADMILHKLISE